MDKPSFEITSGLNGGRTISFNNKMRAFRSFCHHANHEANFDRRVRLEMRHLDPELNEVVVVLLAEKAGLETFSKIYKPFYEAQ